MCIQAGAQQYGGTMTERLAFLVQYMCIRAFYNDGEFPKVVIMAFFIVPIVIVGKNIRIFLIIK